jgi:hypothetical protein
MRGGWRKAVQLNAFSIVDRRAAIATCVFGGWPTQLTSDERELK